jgi:hypothetical protein
VPLRDHEGERAYVPWSPREFDACSIREVFRDHMARHVPPARASPEKIVLRAELICPSLAFAGDPVPCLRRIGPIVGHHQLDVPTKFLPRDGPRDFGHPVRWRTDGNYLRTA